MGPEPPKTTGGAQRQRAAAVLVSTDNGRPLCFVHTIVHTEVQGPNRPYCSRQTVGQGGIIKVTEAAFSHLRTATYTDGVATNAKQ